jgi:voltage-gated potassium channel
MEEIAGPSATRFPFGWLMNSPTEDAPVFALVLYRLRWALLGIMLVASLATVGYVVIDGYGWIDGLYMTVITLGTIGYGEVHPLDTAGRILTIAVIIVGFTAFVYAVSVLTNLFVSGDALRQVRHRRSKRMREELHDHVIVVGFGRVGQAVVRGLQELGRSCVVLDRNPSAEQAIRAAGGVEVIGDATSQDDLRKAGIDRACGLIAACDADSENLVVVLTARATRADLRIVSRVNEATWLDRMKQGGADIAQSPYPSYGMSLAAAAVSSAVLDLHDLPLLGLGTEEIQVPDGSTLVGSTAMSLASEHPCAYVVGLRRDDRLRPWHKTEDAIRAGDVLVALGTPDELMGLAIDASRLSPDPRDTEHHTQ